MLQTFLYFIYLMEMKVLKYLITILQVLVHIRFLIMRAAFKNIMVCFKCLTAYLHLFDDIKFFNLLEIKSMKYKCIYILLIITNNSF